MTHAWACAIQIQESGIKFTSECAASGCDERKSSMNNIDSDTAIRRCAFAHIRRLTELGDGLTAADLAPEFQFAGVRIPLFATSSLMSATKLSPSKENGKFARRTPRSAHQRASVQRSSLNTVPSFITKETLPGAPS